MRFRDTGDNKRLIKHREDMFLRRLFGMLAKMAKADQKVDAWEVHAAEKAFEKFPRAAARRQYCVRVFNEAKNSRISLARMAWDFANKWATQGDCLVAYELLWDIACAKGILKPSHKANLKFICKYLKLPDTYFFIFYRKRSMSFREWTHEDELREREMENTRRREARRKEAAQRRAQEKQGYEWSQWEKEFEEAGARARNYKRPNDYEERMWNWFHRHFKDTTNDSPTPSPKAKSPLQAEYDLLGCQVDASDDAVKSAYRSAAKKYHPDVLRAGGRSEVEIARASVMMIKINAAWAKIRKARGI